MWRRMIFWMTSGSVRIGTLMLLEAHFNSKVVITIGQARDAYEFKIRVSFPPKIWNQKRSFANQNSVLKVSIFTERWKTFFPNLTLNSQSTEVDHEESWRSVLMRIVVKIEVEQVNFIKIGKEGLEWPHPKCVKPNPDGTIQLFKSNTWTSDLPNRYYSTQCHVAIQKKQWEIVGQMNPEIRRGLCNKEKVSLGLCFFLDNMEK